MMKDLGLTRNAAASPRMLHDLDSDLAVSNEPPGIEVEVPPNPRLVAMMEREGVGAEKFRVLAARLQYFRKQRQLKKVVITNSPPLAPVADPNLWAMQADGTLLVVEQGKTPKKLLRKSLESIENLKLIGVVMNGSQDADHQYYRQYYKSPANSRASAGHE